jgi:DNA-directed RNA polymerase specialized sigma24 family protein
VSDREFNRLSESELQRLSSDELIKYIREATEAGRADRAQTGLAILCYRHLDDVKRRIALRVPPEHVEDQAMVVMLAAIKSAFDGTSIGEFRVWLNKIIDRRGIADFHRSREDKPTPVPLPTEHKGDEEIWGEEPAEADETGRLAVQSVIDECMAGLSESHRDVIELNVFEDRDAGEAAKRVNELHPDLNPAMSDQNVHKIVSRFRKCVTLKLQESD